MLTPPVVNTGRSAADLTEESTFTGCILAMVLVNDVVGAGGYLEGELRARMNITDQAKNIRIELLSSEKAGDREDESVRERVTLQSDVQLTSERPYVWAFSLAVPERTLPTVQTGHTTVAWRLKAVVDTETTSEAYHLAREVPLFTSPLALLPSGSFPLGPPGFPPHHSLRRFPISRSAPSSLG